MDFRLVFFLLIFPILIQGCGQGDGAALGDDATCPLASYSARTVIDGSGTTGLNFGADTAATPHLAEMQSGIYATWSEMVVADGLNEIQVYSYNGNDSSPSWTRIVGASTNGLNKDTVERNATNPRLVSFNSKLYATWVEEAPGPTTQIRIAVFNGSTTSPSWSFVDGGSTYGLNKNTAKSATVPQPVVLSGKLYLIWREQNASSINQVRVAVYGGSDSSPSWSFVDGNGANGLNYSSSRDADGVTASVFNSKLYLAWAESNGTATQLRAVVYNGNDSSPSWSFVDGNSTSGLNYLATQNAKEPTLASSGRDLTVGWLETNGTSTQVRVRKYNGIDSSPSWSWLDGQGTNGVSVDVAYGVQSGAAALFYLGYNLFMGWAENDGGVSSVRLTYYSGASGSPFTYLLSSSTANLNQNSEADASIPFGLVTSSCKIYYTWIETDDDLGKDFVRAAVVK
ncbi:MAG: hypothetical protein AB7F86_16685 [Bdellovibrionales bacterium]